jgi:hypothetical protein
LSKTENSGHYCVKAAYIDESNALPLPKKEKKKIPNDARTYHARTTSSTTPTSMRRDLRFYIPCLLGREKENTINEKHQ